MADPLLDELLDWLRIPSISTGGGKPEDLARAADWVCRAREAAGGTARGRPEPRRPPAGGRRAARVVAGRAHGPDLRPLRRAERRRPERVGDARRSSPRIRDGRIYARGASDDKGNFLPLLHVACALARAGELPVNVRVLVEGEEEAGSGAVREVDPRRRARRRRAIVFDSRHGRRAHARRSRSACAGIVDGRRRGPHRPARPALGHVRRQRAERRCTCCTRCSPRSLPGPDGVLREELRAGIEPPAAAGARVVGSGCTPGDEVIAEVGGRPVTPDAGARLLRAQRRRRLARRQRARGRRAAHASCPPTARATRVSCGSRPGQDPDADRATSSSACCATAVPEGAEVDFELAPRRARRCSASERPGDRSSPRRRSTAPRGMAPAFVRTRRLDPGRGRARAQRDPDDRQRLRAPRRRHPRAERVLPRREPAPGRGAARELYAALAAL